MADRGESVKPYRGSNLASQTVKTGKSWAEQPQPHSAHSEKRSKDYHSRIVEPTKIIKGKTIATKARGLLKNDGEDNGEEF